MQPETHRQPNSLLTLDEVARRLSLSRSSIYILMRKGLLPSTKIGKCTRIRLGDVDQYVQRLFGPSQEAN